VSRGPSSGKEAYVSTPERLHEKGAFKQIIQGVGGLEAAEGFCRVGKTMLARYYDPRIDEHAPLDVIADLEPLTRGRAGYPQVTRMLALRQGFALVELPQVDIPDCKALHAALSASMQKSAALHAEMVAAMADGILEPDEGERIAKLSMELAEESLRTNALAKRIAEEC
jgi:hypothetical protein